MAQIFNSLKEKLPWMEKEVALAAEKGIISEKDSFALTAALKTAGYAENLAVWTHYMAMLLNGMNMSSIEESEYRKTESDMGTFDRYKPLIFMEDKDGNRKYVDTNATRCVDVHDPRITYFDPFVNSYFCISIAPPKFPYTPPFEPITVYVEKCAAYHEDFVDTIGILYARKPGSSIDNMLEIKKFFKRNNEKDPWDEIGAAEYAFRCKKGGLLDD